MALDVDFNRLSKVGEIYTPSYPVEIKDLFSGRTEQFQQAFKIIKQKGLHAIIYGDRGVGKTSFSNILKVIFENPPATQVVKISCSSDDTLSTLWKNIFSQFEIKAEEKKNRVSFVKDTQVIEHKYSLCDLLQKDEVLTTQRIVEILSNIDSPIIILDEFDRLENDLFNKKIFTDTLKLISDTLPTATIIIVGVSEDISNLILEHESIERNLGQIYMPTMSTEEIKEIIQKGEEPLNLLFDDDVIDKIVELASGYPHFAHSLCYHAAYAAIFGNGNTVDKQHLQIAIKQTLDSTQESLRNSYRIATLATKQNIFSEVLLAASMVHTDEYGYFQANDLEPILEKILGKEVKVNNFVFHLGKFCLLERGEILRITGSKNRQRYKFKNPLMKAFIRLKMENDKSTEDASLKK